MKKRFEIIQPEYVFVKLKPNNSIKNNSTHLVARTIASMYKSLWSSIIREEEKVFSLFNKELAIPTKGSYKRQGKIGYYVYMEKFKIEFYFIIPKHLYPVMKERISGVWTGITQEVVEEIPRFSEDSYKYQMIYEKEDGLSLVTNRSDNALLNANLNVVELLEEGDRVAILYNFIPMSQNSFKYTYKSTMDKVKEGKPTDRNKFSVLYLVKLAFSFIDSLIKDISEAIAGKSVKSAKNEESGVMDGIIERLNGERKVSESTTNKIKGQVIETQILILSESKDRVKINERSYATSMAQSFDAISGDNRLIKKKYNGKVNYNATRIAGVETNKVWDEEAQNFISLPGRELLERYPFISKVETQEAPLPNDLQKGVMCIGETTFRGNIQKAYLSDDEQFKKLMLLLIGPSRAGKSNLISHLCIDAIENDECVIIMDFIKKCEMSKSVADCFPKEKILEISFDNIDNIQGLGYNEVSYSENDSEFQRYNNAKRQTTNTLALINAVNDGSSDNSRLSPKMERYLECACLVVYISGGSIKDIFGVLLNHNTRYDFIDKIPGKQMDYLKDYIAGLQELDEVKQGEIVGTKVQAGIIDRLNALKRNTYTELMLKKGTENNINLVEEMQKNQVIIIKMPEAMFTTNGEKDIITTYFITKIWLALQVRGDKFDEKDLKKINLVIDEIYQVEHTEMFLKTKLSQIAKFGMKPIISCHYINQLKHMREELRSANASYVLVAGCDKKNFKELKEELYPFTEEDLQNLPRYHALNYIKNKEGYTPFITKLPKRIDYRIKERQLK